MDDLDPVIVKTRSPANKVKFQTPDLLMQVLYCSGRLSLGGIDRREIKK